MRKKRLSLSEVTRHIGGLEQQALARRERIDRMEAGMGNVSLDHEKAMQKMGLGTFSD
jgi:hypothetical protein